MSQNLTDGYKYVLPTKYLRFQIVNLTKINIMEWKTEHNSDITEACKYVLV